MSAGVQKRRHLWKSGWDLGFDYPGKASYLCRAKGIVLFVPRVLRFRFAWGHGWREVAPEGVPRMSDDREQHAPLFEGQT